MWTRWVFFLLNLRRRIVVIKNKPKVESSPVLYRYCTGPSDCRGCWTVWVLLFVAHGTNMSTGTVLVLVLSTAGGIRTREWRRETGNVTVIVSHEKSLLNANGSISLQPKQASKRKTGGHGVVQCRLLGRSTWPPLQRQQPRPQQPRRQRLLPRSAPPPPSS